MISRAIFLFISCAFGTITFSLDMGRAQRKSYKKKGSVGVISLSAESDKGFAPLTAPPLKRRAKLLFMGLAQAFN